MPEYRPLEEGEVILRGDRHCLVGGVPVNRAESGISFRQGHNNIQYYRFAASSQTRTPPSVGATLFDALNDLVAIGYREAFPKWSQWEEIVLAQELIDGISNNGYRELKNGEIVQLGDQHNGGDPGWINSIAIGRTVESQRRGNIYNYRRPVRLKSKRITPAIKAKLIDAIEAILYMGKDEKYNHWEDLIVVVKAYELILKQK